MTEKKYYEVDGDFGIPLVAEIIEEVEEPTVEEPVEVEEEIVESETVEEEIVEVEETANSFSATVANCKKLNIRKEPDKTSEIVAEVPAGTVMLVAVETSTDEWYNVCLASGIEGFCMRQFVTVE